MLRKEKRTPEVRLCDLIPTSVLRDFTAFAITQRLIDDMGRQAVTVMDEKLGFAAVLDREIGVHEVRRPVQISHVDSTLRFTVRCGAITQKNAGLTDDVEDTPIISKWVTLTYPDYAVKGQGIRIPRLHHECDGRLFEQMTSVNSTCDKDFDGLLFHGNLHCLFADIIYVLLIFFPVQETS